jgi:hypothetical protein
VHIVRVHVRFFRSFNFDYERKAHPKAKERPWEMIDGQWWPFVTVGLDRKMTAIVGANESGKSQLIDAVQQALTGDGISRLDFCRYSPLFSVQRDRVRSPDLGLDVELTTDDAKALRTAGWAGAKAGQSHTIVRYGDGRFCRVADETDIELTPEEAEALQARLPAPLVLPANVPLPDSVSFDELLGRQVRWAQERSDRAAQRAAIANVAEATAEAITAVVPALVASLRPYQPTRKRAAMVALARTLLLDVCEIAPSAFEDLQVAHDAGRAGQVGALVASMNKVLALKLNFARWWRQDRDFSLRVSAQADELVFTVGDRTGSEYSFGERSTGLRYFLGYFVRLQPHGRRADRPQMLLMDEPDAYLSSVAQGDLLRVLSHFAAPAGRVGDQVVYVTHSPFLLDRNDPGRIRVLDKGSDQDGTRVVADAVRNHYEPLRSSLGVAAAETAFLGGSNLIVEGAADQVLLAGANGVLLGAGRGPSTLLDLNDVTIVPAGGAPNVPYVAYLARGRDELKPACVALLDGDQAGRDAIKQLRKSTDGRRKRILDDDLIVDVAAWAREHQMVVEDGVTVSELEDLLPVPVAVAAARAYAQRLLGVAGDAAEALTVEDVRSGLGEGGGIFDVLKARFAEVFDGSGLDKLGLAKEVVALLREPPEGAKEATAHLLDNLAALLAHLVDRLAEATAREGDRRRDKRADQIVKGFLRDHDSGATRDEVNVALHAIEQTFEGSRGDEAVAARLAEVRRIHSLNGAAPLEAVEDFAGLAGALRGLAVIRRTAYVQ